MVDFLFPMCDWKIIFMQSPIAAKTYILLNNSVKWYLKYLNKYLPYLDRYFCNDYVICLICFQIIHLSSALESQSCLWFNRDVAADSSGLGLRQQGDSSRSSIWVLHSYHPYTLPSQRSRDTTVRRRQSRFLSPSWSEGCEKHAHWAQSYGLRGER